MIEYINHKDAVCLQWARGLKTWRVAIFKALTARWKMDGDKCIEGFWGWLDWVASRFVYYNSENCFYGINNMPMRSVQLRVFCFGVGYMEYL